MEQYISLETARLAKEKGFNLQQDMFYNAGSGFKLQSDPILRTGVDEWIEAPSQAVLAKWLRAEHFIYITVERCVIGSDEWDFGYVIDYLPKEHHEEKRRVGFFLEKKSFEDNYPYSYTGAWYTWEEAFEKALIEALKLI